MSEQNPNDRVLHQTAHEEVIDKRFERQLEQASEMDSIPNVASVAGPPTQEEFNDLVFSHNRVLRVLRDAKLIPPYMEA